MQEKTYLLDIALIAGLVASSEVENHYFKEFNDTLSLLCDDNIYRNAAEIEMLIGSSAMNLESSF